MADFEEMRNAVVTAVTHTMDKDLELITHTVRCKWCVPGYDVYCAEYKAIQND